MTYPNAIAMDDEKLQIAEETAIRELANARGTTYLERQRFAFAYIRVALERSLREAERRSGVRKY